MKSKHFKFGIVCFVSIFLSAHAWAEVRIPSKVVSGTILQRNEMVANGEMTYGLKLPCWVTDGPEMFHSKTGKLGMLWATWGANRYLQCVAYSRSGTIDGPWIQDDKPLIGNNSGHGMLFTTFEGKRLFIVHHVEGDRPRKPRLWEIDDSGNKLVLGKRYNP